MTTERQPMGVKDALWLEMDRPFDLMVIDSLMWTPEPIDWDRRTNVAVERRWDRDRVFAASPSASTTRNGWPRLMTQLQPSVASAMLVGGARPCRCSIAKGIH